MWALQNETPFAAERTLMRDSDGAELWVVVVKATFAFDPDGSVRPAKQQRPVRRAPKYEGAPGLCTLVADTDLTPRKPATDVLVEGHAYAPGGKAETHVAVTLVAGPIQKTLSVFGDRRYEGLLDITPSAPEPFARMPIVYTRAFGGTDALANPPESDPQNPIGRGFVTDAGHAFGLAVPNIEHPQALLRRAGQRPPPAGFMPVAPSWSSRAKFSGTCDDEWRQTRHPLVPLDFDPRFYCSAPEDQQVTGYLRGGERVSLENMTPDGKWSFSLPRVALGFRTRIGAREVSHRAVIHTVEIRPDEREVSVTFHTALPCHLQDHTIRGTLITQKTILPLGERSPRAQRWRSPVRRPQGEFL